MKRSVLAILTILIVVAAGLAPGDTLISAASDSDLTATTVFNWRSTGQFPTDRGQGEAFVHDGRAYFVGGFDTAVLAEVLSAPIQPDGQLGSWSAEPSMNVGRWSFALAISPGSAPTRYVWSLGGIAGGGGNDINRVEFAPLTAAGIGTWTETAAMPAVRVTVSAVATEDHVYVVGGHPGGTGPSATTVFRADIQPDGHLANWVTLASSLPSPRHAHRTFIHDGHIYAVGGFSHSSNSQASPSVIRAPILGSGDLGSWETVQGLNIERSDFALTPACGGEFVVALGGAIAGPIVRDTVEVSSLVSGGGITPWVVQSETLPSARATSAAISHGDHVYSLGGGALGGFAANAMADVNCKGAGPPPPVGGVSKDTDLRSLPLETAQRSGPPWIAVGVVASMCLLALSSVAWYARRRRTSGEAAIR